MARVKRLSAAAMLASIGGPPEAAPLSTSPAMHVDVNEMKWTTLTNMSLITKRADGHVMMVSITAVPGTEEWGVLALSAPSAEKVLDNHAHSELGTYPNIIRAAEAAESYARVWLKRGKSTRAKRCACDDIDPKKRRK